MSELSLSSQNAMGQSSDPKEPPALPSNVHAQQEGNGSQIESGKEVPMLRELEDGVNGKKHEKHTLLCETLRDKLTPRDSPLVVHDNHGGGFVDDGDRVSVLVRKFASTSSAGCSSQDSFFLNRRLHSITRDDNDDLSDQQHDGREDDHQQGEVSSSCDIPDSLWAVRAGPRRTVYFNTNETNVAIVTCGGLCPGLNDVVRSLVQKLTDYGVPDGNIIGIRYGFRGFYDRRVKPVTLTNASVANIHLQGGTVLGSSRGGADIKEVVKRLDIWGVDMLFVVGGDGGNAGALAIHKQCIEDGVVCAVIGVPKSIDNDIQLIDKTFGFDTAVQESQRALMAAKVEASSALHGIGLVKLMGRQSGFITVQASLASGLVDVCLIPEVCFKLDGENGLMAHVGRVLERQGHCVICVAEGAGQDALQIKGALSHDASGNPVLVDVGSWLKKQLKSYFPSSDVKYIDPSYMIRSVDPIASDRVYAKLLSHAAVHAAFAGYSGITVGMMNTHFVLLPTSSVINQPRTVDPKGQFWARLRGAIAQPDLC